MVCYAQYLKNYRNKTNHYYDPANAAGLPPDLPVATDADAANAGLTAGVSRVGG